MKHGYLSEYFTGVGTKILTRVDATASSNQHEVGDGHNGEVLKRILGDTPRKQNNRFISRYIWIQDEQESITESGFLSWYDTRENQKNRSPEWRLYYQTNPVTEMMTEGDRLFVAHLQDDIVLFIVVPVDSAMQNQLLWLFGLDSHQDIDFKVQDFAGEQDSKLDFISRFIMDEIGVEYEDPNANTLDAIIEKFGLNFPTTFEFSQLARLTLQGIEARNDPDEAIMAWLNHEEALFRRLEKKVVEERIRSGFMNGDEVDVDDFIQFSLSVHNRRKARMGRALENHLGAVFDAHDLKYDTQVVTEDGKRPDFVFPGKEQYFDHSFNAECLTLLAAKSTCKDRWSQILPEGARVKTKHLITLEPGISSAQTDTMRAANVQLVIPDKLRRSYSQMQREWIWKVQDFVDTVSERQRAA